MQTIGLIVPAIVELTKRRPDLLDNLHGRARWIARTYGKRYDLASIKTYDHYLRQIYSLVDGLFDGEISQDDFIDGMAEIIPVQLTKAWNEGMRENGLDPEGDMLEEWQLELDGVILSEFDFVDGFAAAIVDEANKDDPTLDAMHARADLWANRYNDVYSLAKLLTSEGTQKFKWSLGGTEEHCWICQALDGIVAFSREWEQAGFRPQEPPNDLLSLTNDGEKGCGGWRCDCNLEPTNERRTVRALDRLLDIAQGVV